MKKFLWVLIVFIPLLFVDRKEEMRVRVIPNSNSEYDLVVKEKVSKRVYELLVVLLEDLNTFSETKRVIQNNVLEIKDDLCSITMVDVSFEKHNMGFKTDGKSLFESKNHLTLLVKIGEAKGDNWWGTIYPSLLGVSSDEKVTFKWWIKENIGG